MTAETTTVSLDAIDAALAAALAEMPHRIRRAGIGLHAWCAWDPLFLARVIGDLQVATARAFGAGSA